MSDDRSELAVLYERDYARLVRFAALSSGAYVMRSVINGCWGLPQRQREVMFLRYYLDQSEEGIARAMGISRGAVKTHAARAAGNLRSLLEGDQ
ncbi:hypothetical protein OWR29_08305 [Actinoplanes sp. Pm04-4]|uniref:RNA polymerase sigma factor 70 region 4 type 2 domain-containing protein n=1 Tax=Paractinoplanes pyxinae TaxID=2997416 RepID=A0ABT4AUT0_9ACTN|nr:sigma factor-like helix-turn-helix DNA-binding protein [Actinoplanes pyxinae]MCY1137996.1 hypothetical protein [Actinoplanes pyxinae]